MAGVDWALIAKNRGEADPDAMVVSMYHARKSAYEVAERLGVSHGTVVNRLKHLGVDRIYKGHVKGTIKQKQFAEYVCCRDTALLTLSQIAKGARLAVSYTWYLCKKNDVPYKPRRRKK